MKLQLNFSPKRLAATALAKRLGVLLGEFIRQVKPVDTAAVADSPTLEFRSRQNDRINIVAVPPNIVPYKNVIEQISVDGDPDQIQLDYTKPIVNGLTVASQPVLSLQRSIVDGVIFFDDFGGGSVDVGYFRAPNNSFNTSDDLLTEFRKSVGESISLQSQPALTLTRRFVETIAVAESIGSVGSGRFKSPLNTVATVELVAKGNTKPTADSFSAGSVGSLRAQSYTVDMTYFTEDYVGASQTFN